MLEIFSGFTKKYNKKMNIKMEISPGLWHNTWTTPRMNDNLSDSHKIQATQFMHYGTVL